MFPSQTGNPNEALLSSSGSSFLAGPLSVHRMPNVPLVHPHNVNASSPLRLQEAMRIQRDIRVVCALFDARNNGGGQSSPVCQMPQSLMFGGGGGEAAQGGSPFAAVKIMSPSSSPTTSTSTHPNQTTTPPSKNPHSTTAQNTHNFHNIYEARLAAASGPARSSSSSTPPSSTFTFSRIRPPVGLQVGISEDGVATKAQAATPIQALAAAAGASAGGFQQTARQPHSTTPSASASAPFVLPPHRDPGLPLAASTRTSPFAPRIECWGAQATSRATSASPGVVPPPLPGAHANVATAKQEDTLLLPGLVKKEPTAATTPLFQPSHFALAAQAGKKGRQQQQFAMKVDPGCFKATVTSNAEKTKEGKENKKATNIYCNKCNTSFSSDRKLYLHNYKIHPKKMIGVACGKKFKQKSHAKRHMLRCKLCSKIGVSWVEIELDSEQGSAPSPDASSDPKPNLAKPPPKTGSASKGTRKRKAASPDTTGGAKKKRRRKSKKGGAGRGRKKAKQEAATSPMSCSSAPSTPLYETGTALTDLGAPPMNSQTWQPPLPGLPHDPSAIAGADGFLA